MRWPTVKLADVAIINPRLPKDVDEAQDVSFVAMASASEEGWLLSEETKVLADTRKGFTYFERGDVLLAKITPCFENGKCLRPYQIAHNIGFGSTEFHVLRADPEKIDSTYLFYMIWSDQFRWMGETSMSGAAGQKRVGTDFIKKFEVPLPPLAEQKRIAAILDKADAIRRKRQQTIQLADEFLRSVFLDMFGDPVTNPKGWEVKRLGDVVETQLGKMLSKKAKEGKSPRKYLRNANVRWRQFDLSDLLEMDFNQKEIAKFELMYGDLLVCEGGDVGRCSIWRNEVSDCYYQKALHRVRPLSGVLRSEYLQEYFFWMSKRGGLSDSVSEVTFSHLTAEKLKELNIPVPPVELQNKFSEIYEKYLSINSVNNHIKSTVTECFSSVSHKAFAGEL